MLRVTAVFAQLTREMISENTKDGLLRRRESGQSVGSLTRTYGCDYSAEQGGLVINSEEAAVVRQKINYAREQCKN